MAAHITLRDYYKDPAVRARIREYCGEADGRPATCAFVAAMTGQEGAFTTWDRTPQYPFAALDTLMASGADIARSTWDSANLLIHLDLDYLNVDMPGEAYHHSGEVFFKLEPLYRAAAHVLRRFGMPLMPLVTGRGYHFTGQVPLDSDVVDRLAALTPRPPRWVETFAERRPAWMTADLPPRHARAYAGAGILAEFLAHQILRRARRRSLIPIVFNGTIVGTGLVGRECASIDISYAGDPMDVRHQRVAFGAYQKHRFRPDMVGPLAAERQPFVAVPRANESLVHLLSHGRELGHAARLARRRSAPLPEVTGGARAALEAYGRSALAPFHREFYAAPARSPQDGDALFRSLRLASLPDCVARPLLAPNDLLLQPTVVQHVTRALMADGLQPRDIAAIMCSRFAADLGWGARWSWMDRGSRADFDVRVFAGMLRTHLDEAIDFNCRSAQEKGLCPGSRCTRDLRQDRERLLQAVAS